jgi:hypothetical protein
MTRGRVAFISTMFAHTKGMAPSLKKSQLPPEIELPCRALTGRRFEGKAIYDYRSNVTDAR